MNTTEFLTISSAICPNQTAIVFEGKRFSFAQLSGRINRLANALTGIGVARGDSVALLQVNCNECIEAYFATAKLGAIYVPLNFRAKGNELTYMLNTADTKVVFVGDRYTDIIDSIRGDLTSVEHFVSIDGPREGWTDYAALIVAASDEDIFTDIDDDDITILMYTAGTTGFPKGVMLSHNSFSIYVMENVTPADPETDEKNILTVPLYHVAGIQAMMAAVYGGRTMVMERQFDPVEWMTLVQQEKVDRAMMVPTMLKLLLEHPDFEKYDLSSLRVVTYGAASMPLPVIRKAMEVFPDVSFINAFGQTETASTITTLGPEDHNISGTEEEKKVKLKRLSSIGRPMSDIQMQIVDEDNNPLPVGDVGEIVARGPRVMSGYWKESDKTAKTIDSDGWVHTGDMGYVDEAGYYFLAGRNTDMIIRGGENISPEEVEIVLNEHEAIEEVAVIGIPDDEWGEVPVCIVVIKQGQLASEDEIRNHCRQSLASYKRPRSVFFTEEPLPRNQLGKVLKKQLREEYGSQE